MNLDQLPLFHTRYLGQISLAHHIIELRLQTPDGFTWQAGDYLWLGAGDLAAKPFSFANTPTQQEIHLQLVLTPQNQQWLEALSQHDSLVIRGPVTQYRWSTDQNPVLLLAGGTGITPLMNLLFAHKDELSTRSVQLYWGVKTWDDAYQKEQLDLFQQTYPQFQWHCVLSQSDGESSQLTGLLPDVVQQQIPKLDPNTHVLICGPWPMVNACKTWAMSMGIDESRIQS